jgi:hypothetical protein
MSVKWPFISGIVIKKRSIVVLSCSSDLLVISLPEPGGFTGSLQAVPQSTGQQMVPKIYK